MSRHTTVGLVRSIFTVTVEIADPTLSDAASRMTAHKLIRPAAAVTAYTRQQTTNSIELVQCSPLLAKG